MSFSQLRVKEQQYHSLNPYYNGKYSMRGKNILN